LVKSTVSHGRDISLRNIANAGLYICTGGLTKVGGRLLYSTSSRPLRWAFNNEECFDPVEGGSRVRASATAVFRSCAM